MSKTRGSENKSGAGESERRGKQPTSSRTSYILGALAVLVIGAIVVVGIVVQADTTAPRADGYGSVKNPAVEVSLDAGVVTVGLPTATKVVDIYEDALCPFCAELERTHGQEIAQKVDEGNIKVRYHMLDFLNEASASGDYSTRAVAASECVASTATGAAYSKFHAGLFDPAFQPKEKGSSDHSNDDLAALARNAGAGDAAAQCITDGAGSSAAAANAAAASKALSAAGGKGTPTVVVNGSIVDTDTNPNWAADL